MDHATPSPIRIWGITLLYNFAFKSNYGSWIYKIRQIYESPVDHSFCYEYRRDSFCIWKRRWNSSKKISEQVIWPILKNFHLIRGCVLSTEYMFVFDNLWFFRFCVRSCSIILEKSVFVFVFVHFRVNTNEHQCSL